MPPPERSARPSLLVNRPDGMKNDECATRSISCMMPAASSGGKASSSRKPVTSIAQTKNGMRIQVMPRARRLMMVVMKLTEPKQRGGDQADQADQPLRLAGEPLVHDLAVGETGERRVVRPTGLRRRRTP